MFRIIANFKTSEAGATLVEYGVALILAIVLGGVSLTALSDDVGDQMGQAGSTMVGEGSYTAVDNDTAN